jgi:hypothetical protein
MLTMHERFDLRLVYERLTTYSTANARRRGDELRVICPVHEDQHPSCDLNLARGLWICRACGASGDAVGMVLARGIVGGSTAKERYRAAFAWLRGLDPRYAGSAPMPNSAKTASRNSRTLAKITARHIYPYIDEDGRVLYEVVREEGINHEGEPDKDFRLRRVLPPGAWIAERDRYVYRDLRGETVPVSESDPSPLVLPRFHRDGRERRHPRGRHAYRMEGVRRVLYRLPEVRAAARGFGRLVLVEGEKKAEALRARMGLAVTTIAGGANALLETAWLRDILGVAQLVVMADADDPGRRCALERGRFFTDACTDVRVLAFADSDDGYDVGDWLQARKNCSRELLLAELAERLGRTLPLGSTR